MTPVELQQQALDRARARVTMWTSRLSPHERALTDRQLAEARHELSGYGIDLGDPDLCRALISALDWSYQFADVGNVQSLVPRTNALLAAVLESFEASDFPPSTGAGP